MEKAVLFLSLTLAVNLAVYGWLGALEARSSSKEANRYERFVYYFIAGVFTALAVGAWYGVSLLSDN